MAELPIMPLHWPALLADTSHMTTTQFGAYCRLLGAMWLHGGQLVDNDGELRRVSGISSSNWRKNREAIMRPMTIKDGIVTQKRLAATLVKVQEKHRKLSAAGHKRWTGKPKQPRISRAIAGHEH